MSAPASPAGSTSASASTPGAALLDFPAGSPCSLMPGTDVNSQDVFCQSDLVGGQGLYPHPRQQQLQRC